MVEKLPGVTWWVPLTFTTLLANPADDKLVIFFFLFQENRIWYYIQIGDSMHELSNPVFWKRNNKKNISKCFVLKFLPRVQSVKPMQLIGSAAKTDQIMQMCKLILTLVLLNKLRSHTHF